MLTIADVSKSYGARELFANVSLFIARTDRFGLVGANGAGKSTLFNLILGQDEPDTGLIEWERGADFGFLPQESAPVGKIPSSILQPMGRSLNLTTMIGISTTRWSQRPRRYSPVLVFGKTTLKNLPNRFQADG